MLSERLSSRIKPHALLPLDQLVRPFVGAGGAAHLAGVVASVTSLPVIGVPLATTPLNGMDSLLAIVQMPAGIPVGTLAIGPAGARNAALLAVAILANSRPELREKLRQFRISQSEKVLRETLP